MRTMRPIRRVLAALLPVALVLTGCQSSQDPSEVTTIVKAGVGAVEDQPILAQDEDTQMVRNTSESVKRYEELRLQGLTRAQHALQSTISRTVDDNFDVFRDMALDGKLKLHRNMALRCLGFAREQREDAREVLIQIASNRKEPVYLVANAALGLGILRDPDTPLEPIVALLGSGDPVIRTSAARALSEIVKVKKTPRPLTPQYLAAIDRCATMLYDKHNRSGRRAAVFALGNMRHPDNLDHLIAALDDTDDDVQIGGLIGITMLGDQRAIGPLIEYLRDGPTSVATTWTVRALKQIANQSGLAKTPGETQALGDSPRKWEDFFRGARMR